MLAVDCSLMIFFTLSSSLRTADEDTCCWLLPRHLPSYLGSEHQKVPCWWTFFLLFWLLRTNKKSQTSDPCSLFPKRQNSSVLPAFFFLYVCFKHNSIWPYQAFSWFFVNQQTYWYQCLPKTFVHEEVLLQIIAWSCFLSGLRSFTSVKPLS